MLMSLRLDRRYGGLRSANFLTRPAMLLAWVCLLAAAVVEAGPIHPPLQTLRNGHYTLVSAEVDHYDAEQRELTLKKVVKLRGPVNVAESIQVEVPANAAAAMAAGQRWLLVYSDVRRDSREARRNVRTDRRFIVHTDGADPAIFRDTDEMRALLADDHRTVEQSEDYPKVIRAGLRSEDPKLVDLWLAEYVYRPGTFQAPSAVDQQRFGAIVADANQLPAARARVLLAAIDRGPAWLASWVADAAGNVLEAMSPADVVQHPEQRQLIYAALVVAERLPRMAHRKVLIKWLGGDDGIAESAIDALAALGADVERDALVAALEAEEAPAPTLLMIRRRLALLQN
ncbi:MAG: hypothetical protein KDI51_00520 [Xanthomonadales bacterium]|nr:hypothetical protein [Xanthomonadales bacterium]